MVMDKSQVQGLLFKLGFPVNYMQCNSHKMHADIGQESMELIDKNVYQRPALCTPETKIAWDAMIKLAHKDEIDIKIVSSYRSIQYQANLIQKKLDQGQVLKDILKVNAAPGFSEHHTGRALDLTTNEETFVLTEDFENTKAFRWLVKNAQKFGFILSYPRANKHGYIYEPWHWCYQV